MTWHLVTTDYPPLEGGIATWASATTTALRAAGEHVVVYAPRRLRAPDAVGLWGRAWSRWASVWVTAQVLPRLRDGDRVLAATWPLATGLLGRCDVSVVFHGSDLTRPARVAGLEAVRGSARLLPVSRFLGGLLAAPHTVLPMPLAPASRATPGDDLLTIARLSRLKGVDRVIRLAAREGRGVTVVGEGPERAALEKLAATLGVRARFTGRLARAEIPWDGHYAALLLSRTDVDGSGAEGLGLVLLEAASRGIPTVGCRIGGVPEASFAVLDDPEMDMLPVLPFGDEPAAFVHARHSVERSLAVLLAPRVGVP